MNSPHVLPQQQNGMALISVLMMLIVMMALLGAYVTTTQIELATVRYSKSSTSAFSAAEAGLNLRADDVRQTFIGYNRPAGTSPSSSNACEGANQGSGDFACESLSLNNYNVISYVEEDASNPIITTVPPGELYQNLNAQEYRYTVRSVAKEAATDRIGAILELRFKSRLVPLFQFVAFYDKDLEILPGPSMTLSGPVHTNGDLYLNANNRLQILGQVTTADDLYRGRKNDSSCMSKPVQIKDPSNFVDLIPSCPSRTMASESDIAAYNGMVETQVDVLTVPEPESLDPSPGQTYWDYADLRLVLRLDGSNNPDTTHSVTGVEVRNSDNSVNATATNNLHSGSCSGQISGRPVGTSNTFYNNREGRDIRMLEVDMRGLLDCLNSVAVLDAGKALNDSTQGGLIFHLSVSGPDSTTVGNPYGVRIRNAAEIQSTDAAAPQVQGLTMVSDQAGYLWGDFNSSNWIPAALLADTFNALSNAWDDSKDTQSVNNRNATNTTFNVAVLAGTDVTGGSEGPGGQDSGNYNGGLENYPRMHEDWGGRTLTYRGSFVSLGTPRYQNGGWVYGSPQYKAPGRDWDYDTRFNDASNLPPLSPRFVYLRQELFVRDFEQ